MKVPWRELADKTLGLNDNTQKSFPCSFNKQYGHICLGKNGMVFVSEKGFLKKKFEILLDAPYNEVTYRMVDRFKIDLFHKSKTYHIDTLDMSAKALYRLIENMSNSLTQVRVIR
jgi:hypothetical protein